MNNIQVFTNEQFGQVRTVVIDGKPYFVANDIARALGYKRPADAVTAHCKGSVKHRYPTDGGEQDVKVIPEGDMYRLIIHSKLPSAEQFESWIFDEVIPSIRKHGAYMTDETLEKALLSPDFLIRLAQELKSEKEKNAKLTAENERMQPLADFATQVSEATNLIDMNSMAKLLHDRDNSIDIGRNKLFKLLRDKEILMSNNQPYQRYVTSGYFKVKEYTYDTPFGKKVNTQTLVTGKGQLWIFDLVKQHCA